MASVWKRQFSRKDNEPDKDIEIKLDTLLEGDPFADWLRHKNRVSYRIFHELLSDLTKNTQYSIKIYVVGDGSYVDQRTIPEGWFQPHVRLLAVATLNKDPNLKFFVVGPLKVNNPEGFLQVASWNGKAFHYFAVEDINGSRDRKDRGWTYQGSSYDAFTDSQSYDASYLGPFNGHVNGTAIMKEIHQPWYHWLSSANSNFVDCISPEDLKMVQEIPYLVGSDGSPLAGPFIDSADNLEPIVKDTVTDWYQSRVNFDFCDPADKSHQKPRNKPLNIHRWMAHLLLTTTVNFAASNSSDATTYTVPNDHFYNAELLAGLSFKDKKLLPDSTPQFQANMSLYEKAVQNLHISLIQEVENGVPAATPQRKYYDLGVGTLGGGRQTDHYDLKLFVETLAYSEGVPFVCLQASVEDAQGVIAMQRKLQSNGKRYPSRLLSETAVQAILMLDFPNPVYSWRRGILMQYLPQTTTLTQSTSSSTYDLEQQLLNAVRKSSFVTDAASPEYRFLQLYDSPPGDFQKIFSNYFSKIQKRLKTLDGIQDYLMLAESRRRTYRPLPLDEFGAQLPYALSLDREWSRVEMTSDGTITAIPQRGLDFLDKRTESLHGFDPHILPSQGSPGSIVPQATASRCPAMGSRRRVGNVIGQTRREVVTPPRVDDLQVTANFTPTWDDDVAKLFSEPYWVDGNASNVGSFWIRAMCSWSPSIPKELHLNLADHSSVQHNIVTIYRHLRSRSMPITNDASQFWPEEALETLRMWANQGFRKASTEPIQSQTIISSSDRSPLKLRKDILSLTPDELRTYREKLNTVLQVGSLSSKWQELGLLHTEWCLHYQQATFFWHRAYLAYVENLIDFPIPYWNGFAADTSDVNSPHAGLPSIFTEESYVNSTGETRPNPLRYACAYNGKNKTGSGQYVERYAVLAQGPSPQDPRWVEKVHLFQMYHDQIVKAFDQPLYSVSEDSEGIVGLPWANLPAFSDNQDPSKYPERVKQMYFDGNFELVHDNYHGWVGPDMADNTYTAFDPIFLSYHANMDRIVEMYLRKKPGQQLTSGFPLQPFIDNGRDITYSDPCIYVYTTIGDMAKPSQALGYLYAPPATPDYLDIQTSLAGVYSRMRPSGGSSMRLSKAQETQDAQPKPKVVFVDVSCTKESFQIDVFVRGAGSLDPNPVKNPDFIGRMTRLGMGSGRGGAEGLRNPQRCNKAPVARILDAAACEKMLREARAVQQVVTHLGTGKVVDESEWKQWPGFEGKLVWL